jgi:hypothetical protein
MNTTAYLDVDILIRCGNTFNCRSVFGVANMSRLWRAWHLTGPQCAYVTSYAAVLSCPLNKAPEQSAMHAPVLAKTFDPNL